jgi:hypothetical protein
MSFFGQMRVSLDSPVVVEYQYFGNRNLFLKARHTLHCHNLPYAPLHFRLATVTIVAWLLYVLWVCGASAMILSLLVLHNPPPSPRHLPHLPLPNLLSSLSSLSLPPSPLAMAGCCVLGRRGWTPWALSSPLGSSSLSSLSPHPPQQRSVRWRRAMEEEGVVAIALALMQCHHHIAEEQAKQARGCFHGPHCWQPLWEQCFFVRTATATRKTKIGDRQCKYYWKVRALTIAN